jgi:hypothetical protein
MTLRANTYGCILAQCHVRETEHGTQRGSPSRGEAHRDQLWKIILDNMTLEQNGRVMRPNKRYRASLRVLRSRPAAKNACACFGAPRTGVQNNWRPISL